MGCGWDTLTFPQALVVCFLALMVVAVIGMRWGRR